jgi:hypothetical protein
MSWFFGILKISSVIETSNSHWTNNAICGDDYQQKQAFSVIQHWLPLRLFIYFSGNKLKPTEFHSGKFFLVLDKKQYKSPFNITVISLWRLVEFNLEILLILKTLTKNGAIKWLPAFYY